VEHKAEDESDKDTKKQCGNDDHKSSLPMIKITRKPNETEGKQPPKLAITPKNIINEMSKKSRFSEIGNVDSGKRKQILFLPKKNRRRKTPRAKIMKFGKMFGKIAGPPGAKKIPIIRLAKKEEPKKKHEEPKVFEEKQAPFPDTPTEEDGLLSPTGEIASKLGDAAKHFFPINIYSQNKKADQQVPLQAPHKSHVNTGISLPYTSLHRPPPAMQSPLSNSMDSSFKPERVFPGDGKIYDPSMDSAKIKPPMRMKTSLHQLHHPRVGLVGIDEKNELPKSGLRLALNKIPNDEFGNMVDEIAEEAAAKMYANGSFALSGAMKQLTSSKFKSYPVSPPNNLQSLLQQLNSPHTQSASTAGVTNGVRSPKQKMTVPAGIVKALQSQQSGSPPTPLQTISSQISTFKEPPPANSPRPPIPDNAVEIMRKFQMLGQGICPYYKTCSNIFWTST